ncbi:glycoside hydrolase family 15 protein [Isoptericola sp. NEAU-Y5]|uniref:Glycoside hydrolase family 15 protein n=1 Tax=Isoptericola luteus TaxID=2879484 RepID=A0ABS7ZG73_9MICO|nr:glycoside hydrolase family 15 protein [Isoptericola sp. NEAU-Y5]MCA5893512.1 glycoside hydrolase family 15 protein [Isoptericola sp. NEAU-Y5]
MAHRIEDYGLVGDLQTAALVGRDGSIDWLCLPYFDSPACFAALLGDADHGSWQIAPATGGPCTTRRYRGDTLVLESEWETPDGVVRVTDFMPPRGEAPDLVRIVEGVRGRVPMVCDLRLRFDYGSVVPWVTSTGAVTSTVAGPDAVTITTPVELATQEGPHSTLRARFEVAAGDRVPFVLTHHPSHRPAPQPADPESALTATVRFWEDWVAGTRYEGRWTDAVRRSLVTLKALTFAPTGGITAAATTSLPEEIGGSRNWDYRFCWLRDAAFTLLALMGTGHTAEAKAWREWLLRAVAGDPSDLQIMYGLDGRRRIPENTLDWLPGYERSGPVRVGNGAAGQLQLDVWGEVLVCLDLARESGIQVEDDAWRLQVALLDFLEGHWQDLDNGLWEVRGPRRAFVHSRVMAWAGVDRGVRAIERLGLDGPVDTWRALRDEIHADVLRHGYDAERNTFTQFYGSEGLDASLLLLPRVGFLPWSDPRVVGTVDAVQRELSVDGLLLRYHTHADDRVDGLPGREGTFLVCSFWLAHALHGIGRHDEAVDLFERLLALRNDLGLLSEEYDVPLGRQLGNTPQAFSHVGLVNTARALGGGSAADAFAARTASPEGGP